MTNRSRAGERSNNPVADMKWTGVYYANGVVIRGGQRLVGWPNDEKESIPFGNLSDIPGGQPVIERLLELWEDGTIHFETADAAHIDLARRNPKAVLPGKPPPLPKPRAWGPYGRNDIGKRRRPPVVSAGVQGRKRRRRDGAITPKLILGEGSDIDETEEIDSDFDD